MLNVYQICYRAQRWIKAHRFQIAVRDAESIRAVTVLRIWGAQTDSSSLIPAFREERLENCIHVGEHFSFRMDEISILHWKVSYLSFEQCSQRPERNNSAVLSPDLWACEPELWKGSVCTNTHEMVRLREIGKFVRALIWNSTAVRRIIAIPRIQFSRHVRDLIFLSNKWNEAAIITSSDVYHRLLTLTVL